MSEEWAAKHRALERVANLEARLAAKDLAYRQERDARLVAQKELGTASLRWQAEREKKDREIARAVELLEGELADHTAPLDDFDCNCDFCVPVRAFLASLTPTPREPDGVKP